MKTLIKHLLENNTKELVGNSYLDCHCKGLHSIMLLESPGKTIRLYVADIGNELYKNLPCSFYSEKMSLAFHAHHCNLTLSVVKGSICNWIVKPNYEGEINTMGFRYHSQIKGGKTKFERILDGIWESKDVQSLIKGSSSFMRAGDIHTVGCHPDKVSAWLVYEGMEDKSYQSFCWSNHDISKESFSHLYRKPTYDEIVDLLYKAGLL